MVPYRTGISGPPNSHIDGDWLTGTPDTAEAAYAQTIARNLSVAMGGTSLRKVGETCGVHHTTIAAIAAGDRWPDMVTLARLETGLDTRLWPNI